LFSFSSDLLATYSHLPPEYAEKAVRAMEDILVLVVEYLLRGCWPVSIPVENRRSGTGWPLETSGYVEEMKIANLSMSLMRSW
jgi:hypothetical protein